MLTSLLFCSCFVAFLSIGSVTTGSQLLDSELVVENSDLSVAESQYRRHPKHGMTIFFKFFFLEQKLRFILDNFIFLF